MDIFDKILQIYYKTRNDKRSMNLAYYRIIIHIMRDLRDSEEITNILIFLLSLFVFSPTDLYFFERKLLSEFEKEEKSHIIRVLKDELNLL